MAVGVGQRAVFEGQRVFLSRKCLPAQLIGTLQDVLKDNGAIVCVFSDASCNASTDFHVLASFDNEKFEEFQAKGCNVVGPECVLRCAKDRRPLPSQRYACCIAMDGVGILATGFSSKEKEDIQQLVVAMCGQLQDDPAQVNFVIAKSVLAAKYKCAQKLQKPVLTVDWIQQCSKEHRLVPTESYRLQPFVGLTICVTNIAPDVRKEIATRTVEHGGQFSGNLTKECTHLIAKSPEGDKYRVAKFWTTVNIVNEQWFWQSIEAKACLEETLFPVTCVTDLPNQGKATGPALEITATRPSAKLPATRPSTELPATRLSLSSPLMQSTIAQPGANQNLVACQQEAPSFVPCTETKLQGAPLSGLGVHNGVDSYDGDGLYLSSCQVYLAGFTSTDEKEILSMLFDGAATRYTEFRDSVTHIIFGQPADSDLKEIRRLMMWGAVHVVFPSWVVECTKKREEVSTKDHLVPSEHVLQVSSTAQGKRIGRVISNARTCIENRENISPPEVVGSVQDFQQGKSGFASIKLPGEESTSLNILPCIQDSSANGACLGESSNRVIQPSTNGLVTVPATQLELLEKSEGPYTSVFSGYAFGLLQGDSMPSQQTSEVMNLIIRGGGSLEHDVSLTKLNFVVYFHETRKLAHEYNGSAQVVSDIWIRHCAEDQKLLDVRGHILYQPLQIQLPWPGFEKNVLCPSQLTEREREFVLQFCLVLGCKYTDDLVRPVTHLICRAPEGEKYHAAVRLSTIAIVSQDWLIACASKNMIVPVDEYRIGNQGLSDRLDDIPSSVAIAQGTATVVECGPSVPEISVATSDQNHISTNERGVMNASQIEIRGTSTAIKGKKGSTRLKQTQQARFRTRGAEIRLSQGVQNQADSNLDPWDSLAAPWASSTSTTKKIKASPESAKGSPLPRPATRSQHKLQAASSNFEELPVPSTEVQHQGGGRIDESSTSKLGVGIDNAVTVCGEPLRGSGEPPKGSGEPLKDSREPLKDSGEGPSSEDVAAAIEGLLAKTSKVMENGASKMDVASALLSPEQNRVRRKNQDDSLSQSEFKRPKLNWHRTRSSTAALNPASNDENHGTLDRFEDTQLESQVVAYEDDHAGRQLILEKVRTRRSTKATIRRTEKKGKDMKEGWKERLCRVADGNK